MIELIHDWDFLVKATECRRDLVPIGDLEIWFDRPRNLMLKSGDNLGLASYEYPGLYSVHWYYEARGREAINLGIEMLTFMFTDTEAKALRAFIRKDLKASRWACRQIGMTSMGIMTFSDGEDNELFVATKDDYLRRMNNGHGR